MGRMAAVDALLQDQLLRLLEGAPNGMTVERLRSVLQAGGSKARKDQIAGALRALSERGLVQVGAPRKWHLRHRDPAEPAGTGSGEGASNADWIAAIPCSATLGDEAVAEDAIPDGQIASDLQLLKRLLPYYQEALRAGDGGAPLGTLERHGDGFVFVQPDAPWWPTATQRRTIRVPQSRLPAGFQSLLSKSSGGTLILGYPIHAITPRGDDARPFFRPVSTFRCRFTMTDSHLKVFVPAMPPAIVRDWIGDERKYGGWDATRLRSWLLLEDERGDLRQEDDIAAAEFVEIPSFASRLTAAIGKDAREHLDPGGIAGRVPASPKSGYYNALVLMPDTRGKYTRSAIHDLDAMQGRAADAFSPTALDVFFGGEGHASESPPILHPFPLAESQLLAARAALSKPLTVITGPPGTGKSQVIAAMMVSAAAEGRSVLFAARQHRAIDAVVERLDDLVEDRVILVRANQADSFGSFSFSDALKGLQTRAGNTRGAQACARILDQLADLDARRWALLERWRELTSATEQAAGLLATVDRIERDLASATTEATVASPRDSSRKSGIFSTLLYRLRRLLPWRPTPIPIGKAWRRNQLAKNLSKRKQELAEAERRIAILRAELDRETESPVDLSNTISGLTARAIPALLDRLDDVSPADRQSLIGLDSDAALRAAKSLPRGACELILKHLPLWAVTTLAAGSRIPIEAGLFDYVIFDEAAQTDIASAIPLLYRAKAAVVVGDPMQLAMISNLDPKEERDLLRRHDLLREGIGRFAQGRTTLFDLASSCLDIAPFILTDHYRCHPQIAAYFNEAFYGRKLTALTDVSKLKVPRGFRAGLHWTPVTGPIVARAGGSQSGSASSEAEAVAIVTHLGELLAQSFEGTVGIVTFFDYQAKTILEIANRLINVEQLDELAIKIFTAHKFQGDERDVMLLSLCLGPTMPSGAKIFIQKERRLLNVAISRARAICHVFGDFDYALHSGIPHIETLARKVRQDREPRPADADDRFESPWEIVLYHALVKRGFSPIPQLPVGGRFLDLALVDDRRAPPKRIDIEVDGWLFHTDADGNRLPTDLWRDHQLRALGWTVLRFWVYELRDDMETCLDRVEAEYRA